MANPSTPIRNQGETKSAGQAGQFGSDVKNKAQDVGASVADKARDVASAVSDKAHDVGSAVSQRTQEATSAVAGGMKSLADTMRENLPHEGMMGRASSAVADRLESGSRYLREEGLSGIADDLTGLIRRNPIPAMLVGIGIGFLLARATRS